MSAEPDKGLGLDGFDSSRIRDKTMGKPVEIQWLIIMSLTDPFPLLVNPPPQITHP